MEQMQINLIVRKLSCTKSAIRYNDYLYFLLLRSPYAVQVKKFLSIGHFAPHLCSRAI